MTARELIRELNSIDDDVLDMDIVILVRKKLNDPSIIHLICSLTKVDENLNDTGNLVLKAQ